MKITNFLVYRGYRRNEPRNEACSFSVFNTHTHLPHHLIMYHHVPASLLLLLFSGTQPAGEKATLWFEVRNKTFSRVKLTFLSRRCTERVFHLHCVQQCRVCDCQGRVCVCAARSVLGWVRVSVCDKVSYLCMAQWVGSVWGTRSG